MPDLTFSLPWLLAALGLVALLALLIALFRVAPRPPYEKRDDFLSPAELQFFRALESAVDGEFYIFSKVRIADLLRVAQGAENARGWFARIGQKHVDFVLADRAAVVPILVIELDDSSHQRADRQQRDEFVDSAMQAAGLPILRVKAARDYSTEQLADAIRRQLASI